MYLLDSIRVMPYEADGLVHDAKIIGCSDNEVSRRGQACCYLDTTMQTGHMYPCQRRAIKQPAVGKTALSCFKRSVDGYTLLAACCRFKYVMPMTCICVDGQV